jgi:hypothetical protein
MPSLILALLLGCAPAVDHPWHGHRLPVRCEATLAGVPPERLDRCWRAACARIEAACDLAIDQVPEGKVTIRVVAGPHDGRGGTLAFTFLPTHRGITPLVLDEAEPWDRMGDAMLTAILTHELGHAVGLEHSPSGDDLMYPVVRAGVLDLSPNDKTRLRALYGPPRGD